jgi:hypothetical protein
VPLAAIAILTDGDFDRLIGPATALATRQARDIGRVISTSMVTIAS